MFEIYDPPKRKLPPIAGVVGGTAGFLGFLYLFYWRYWKWRECFGPDGYPCHNPDGSGDVYITGGMVWGCFSFFFLIVAVISAIVLWRRTRKPRVTP